MTPFSVAHADSIPSFSGVPIASDDGQDPVMVIWTGFAPSWWVAQNLVGWRDTSFCSGSKTVDGKAYNATLERPDPSGLSCIGPRFHVRVWDMGNSSTLGEWSIGSVHHEHTVCDPFCHHIIDDWQTALSSLQASFQGGPAIVSVSTVSLGNAGSYQGVQFDGNLLLVQLKPPSMNPVIFTERGLDSGELWSVTLDRQRISTTGNSITFHKSDGLFTFAVNPPQGFQATPDTGIVNAGQNKTVQIVFGTVWRSSSLTAHDQNGRSFPLIFNGNATVTQPSFLSNSDYSTTLKFGVTELGTKGVINITIPSGVIRSGSSNLVSLDGVRIQAAIAKDANNYYVYLSVPYGSHSIEIRFTPWYSPFISPLLLIAIPAIFVVVSLAVWKRRAMVSSYRSSVREI